MCYCFIYKSWGNIHDLSESCIFPVIPETVGQFTGLTDKNGKKVFEGDVVTKCQQSLIDNIACFHFDYGFVEMNNCAFGVRTIFKDGFERLDDEFEKYKVEYKVISNIHDNPEMISIKKGNNNNEKYDFRLK